MRNRFMIVTAALLLASASLASAQEKPVPQQTQQTGQTVSTGTNEGVIDIAGRFTSTSGDEARYERYRDLRTGVNANFFYSKKTDDYIFNVTAQNIGYRD